MSLTPGQSKRLHKERQSDGPDGGGRAYPTAALGGGDGAAAMDERRHPSHSPVLAISADHSGQPELSRCPGGDGWAARVPGPDGGQDGQDGLDGQGTPGRPYMNSPHSPTRAKATSLLTRRESGRLSTTLDFCGAAA